jgi:hypothetical protein
MQQQKSNSAFEKLLHLHSAAGEAVAQFAAIGAIREVIFRPGSVIFDAYQRDAQDARSAIDSLGDSKASALMAEVVDLARRMARFESTLPPAQPLTRDLKTRQTSLGSPATAPSGELNLAGIALYLGTGTLWNYLSEAMSRPELQVQTRYVVCQSELEKWCKWNGTTNDQALEAVIEKVTYHLATLCV